MDNSSIYKKGKGVILRYFVKSISNYEVFANDSVKEAYINALGELDGFGSCVLAYCVVSNGVYILVKGINKSSLNNYIMAVNNNFFARTTALGLKIGYPLQDKLNCKKINAKNLQKEICGIHHQCEPEYTYNCYPFSSYKDLVDGCVEAVNVILAEYPDLTQEGFLSWFDGNSEVPTYDAEDEKFGEVIKSARSRYLVDGKSISEANIIFTLAEVCDRTRLDYYQAYKKLALPKGRRDLMIGTICDMMKRRGHSFMQSVNIMGLEQREELYDLVLETIAEFNRLYKYSYDYIIALMDVVDPHYEILGRLFKGLNSKFGYGFVELCQTYSVQNDIMAVRKLCGF